MSKGEIVYGWWVPTTFCHRNLPPVAGRLPGRERVSKVDRLYIRVLVWWFGFLSCRRDQTCESLLLLPVGET